MQNIKQRLGKFLNQKNYRKSHDDLISEVMKDIDVRNFLDKYKNQLTKNIIEKSYAKLYEFVQEKAKYKFNSPKMIAPGYEPKLTYKFNVINVCYVPTPQLLEKNYQEKIRSRIQTFHISKEIQKASFLNYENTQGRADAILNCIDFIKKYESRPDIFLRGVYLVGSFGVGKTYLLGATSRRLAEDGYNSMLIHFPTFSVEMKQAIGKDLVEEKLTLIQKTPILMIDDIGADSMSNWIRDDILSIILQYRMQEQLPTFFSSNLTMNELEIHFSNTPYGKDPLKAKRIMERIYYLSKEIMITGTNRRHNYY